MANAPAIIAVGMMASPSSPSVKLTALLVPTITQYDTTMNPQTPRGYDTVLKNGTIRSAFGGRSRLKPLYSQARNSCRNWVFDGADTEKARYSAAIRPITDCAKNFVAAERPLGLRWT